MVQIFPANFIVLASISTLLKAVSGMVNGTAKANVNRHFASAVKGKNLGDVTAKGQSQGVCAYVVGLFYGIGTSYICHMTEGPYFLLSNVAVLTSLHLYNGYSSLKNLNLRFLNDQRGGIVTQHYLSELEKCNFEIPDAPIDVPTPKDVAAQEHFVWNEKSDYSLFMGASVERLLSTKTLQSVLDNTSLDPSQVREKYLINEHGNNIYVSLGKNATERDNLKAFFHTQVFIHNIAQHGDDTEKAWNVSKNVVATTFAHYLESLSASGWETNFILLYLPKETPRFEYEYLYHNINKKRV